MAECRDCKCWIGDEPKDDFCNDICKRSYNIKHTKLYHWTRKSNIPSIIEKGLLTSKMGILYLTKYPSRWIGLYEDESILLEVYVSNSIKLTCFEEFKDGTEVLCWSNISFNNIKILTKA